jgi:hypothetical protein
VSARQFPVEDSLAVLIRECVQDLLEHRRDDSTMCPSEAARILGDELDLEWRDLMRSVRSVAADMSDQGTIDILQSGRPVDIHHARGPIRLRLRRRHDRGH